MQPIVAILPFALAAAVSPLLLAFSILVISSPQKPVQKAWLFVLGNAVAISVIGTAIILFNIGVKQKVSQPNMVDIVFEIVAGVLLVLFAFKHIFEKPKQSKTRKLSSKDGLFKYFIFGIILMFSNYSTIIMYFPAATILSNDFHTNTAKFYGLITMIVFSLIPSLVAPVTAVVFGKRSHVVLDPLQHVMGKYGRILVGVLFGLIGFYLLYRGISEFLVIK